MFLLHIRIKYSIKCFFSAEAILFPVIHSSGSVGNTPYGKRYISRTKAVYGKLNILDKSLHSPQSFCTRAGQFDEFSNPKNASEKNAKNITPPSIGQLEKRTSSHATDVVWH